MKATITSITLRSPLHFFALAKYALAISRQLKKTGYLEFKKRGFWTTHYTMTLWKNEEDLKSFSSSGAHLKAMQATAAIAKEIRTLTINAEQLPTWNEAIRKLRDVKPLTFPIRK